MAILIFGFIVSLSAALLMYHKTAPQLTLYQKTGLIILRTFVLWLLLAFLLSPIFYFIRKYSEQQKVIILRDVSQSMQNKQHNLTKADQLNNLSDKFRKAFEKYGYKVHEHVFADGINGKTNTTYLIPALKQIKAKYGSAKMQVVLLSDGWFRDADLRPITSFGLPVMTVSDTAEFQSVDLKVNELRHNQRGYINELSLFQAGFESDKYRGTATVRFSVNGKVEQSKTISFQKELSLTLDFYHRFRQTGLQKVEVSISAQGISELTDSNNTESSAIDILTDKEKILLLTDTSNWDIRFIHDVIRENNRLEAVSLIVKPDGLYSGDRKTDFNDWKDVTSVIIVNQGTLQPSVQLSTQITDKVKQGAGLAYFGLPVSQLAEILPLKISNLRSSYKGLFKILPAASGYSALQIGENEIAQIPPLDYYYLTTALHAEILGVMDNAQSSPAIALTVNQPGKVLGFAFLSLWRWQLQGKGEGYNSFIKGVLAWLSNRNGGDLAALYKPSYYQDEQIMISLAALDDIRQRKADAAFTFELRDEKGNKVLSDYLIENNSQYQISFRLSQPGAYNFLIKETGSGQSTSGKFMVQSQNLESRDFGYNHSVLNWIAAQTGGRQLNLKEAENYLPVKAEPVRRMEKAEFPLYKKWYMITLFIVLFSLELFLRRRLGLL
jgi:hypothetical protein